MKFYSASNEPKNDDNQPLLLKVPGYSRLEYVVGYYKDGYFTDFGEDDITEYVTAYGYIN